MMAAEGDENTFNQWYDEGRDFARNLPLTYANMGSVADEYWVESGQLPEFARQTAEFINTLGDWAGVATLGIAPGVSNHGGLFGGVAAIGLGDQFFYRVRVETHYNSETGKFELIGFEHMGEVDRPSDNDYVSINGIQNSLNDAIRNGAMQTGSQELIVAFNPQHGLVGDILESAWDKNIGGVLPTGNTRQLRGFFSAGIEDNTSFNIAAHSQGTLMSYRAMDGLDFTNDGQILPGTLQFSGSPIGVGQFGSLAESTGFAFFDENEGEMNYSNTIFQINRPEGETSLFGFALVDSVADFPGLLGGNYNQGEGGSFWGAVFSVPFLFSERSPHSNYLCQEAACSEFNPVPGLEEFRQNLRTPDTNGLGYIIPRIITIQTNSINNQENNPND